MWFVLLLVGLLLFLPAGAPGQTRQPGTPEEEDQTNLDDVWDNVCEGAINDPSQVESMFGSRCLEILFLGPGIEERGATAAMGSNLGVMAAQGRIRRAQEKKLTDVDLHSLNVFATVQGGWSDRRDGSLENGFDSNAAGALLGLDYLPSPTAVTGITLAYSSVSTDFARSAGEMDARFLSITVFESHALTDRLGVDTYLGLGAIDLDLVRNIDYVLVVNPGMINEQMIPVMGTAMGETKGHDLVGGAGLGGETALGRLLVSPRGRMDFLDRSINAYTETDDVGLALSVRDQSITSIIGSLGVEFLLPFDLGWGSLTPALNLDYLHEFRDDAREITASFAGDPARYPFVVNTERPDRDFSRIEASMVALMNSGFALFLNFDSLLGHSFLDDQNLAVGFRAELE